MQLLEPVWKVSEGLKPLKGASGSFGPVEKERRGLPQPILATPRDGLAGFGTFDIEGFEGSIRQFRASRKGKTWRGTAGMQLLKPVWKVSA